MNIYDFDKTIYDGDCSVGFYWYSYQRKPLKMVGYFFKTLGWGILYLFKIITHQEIKQRMFSYVCTLDTLDKILNDFWDKNEHKIKKFYLDNQKDNDVIISASFDFILKPICQRLGVKHLISTKYDLKTGKIIGHNCHDFEKVKRFREYFKDVKVNEAYSDSISDVPMLDLAKKAYVVRGNEIIPLEDYKFNLKKLKKYRNGGKK